MPRLALPMTAWRYGSAPPSQTISKHQRKLLALIKQHGPVLCCSAANSRVTQTDYPAFMPLADSVWCNVLALSALEYKGLIVSAAGKWSAVA